MLCRHCNFTTFQELTDDIFGGGKIKIILLKNFEPPYFVMSFVSCIACLQDFADGGASVDVTKNKLLPANTKHSSECPVYLEILFVSCY